MLEAIVKIYREQDLFAAIEHIHQHPPLEIVGAYDELVRHLYWQEKDLRGAVTFSCAGIQAGLALALGIEDAETVYELRGKAKAMAFNLASFVWPGWDESGIEIEPGDLKLGLDAAKTNLRLAAELDKGDLPLARAHWSVGSMQMALNDQTTARQSFIQSAEYARKAGENGEALLTDGYAALAGILQNPDEAAYQTDLETVKQHLASKEHGADFIAQLDTAAKVFTKMGC
jgi:hypothetical protein